MRGAAVVIATILALGGCASLPKYCEPMLEQNRQIMAQKSDRDVAWLATAFSRANYPGPCACPEDTDAAGDRCGKEAPIRAQAALPPCAAPTTFHGLFCRVCAKTPPGSHYRSNAADSPTDLFWTSSARRS
jgi:hypothetical protein